MAELIDLNHYRGFRQYRLCELCPKNNNTCGNGAEVCLALAVLKRMCDEGGDIEVLKHWV